MQDIQQLCIFGLDEMRPPRVRKEPYIDLHFKLSDKAPAAWCEVFNDTLKNAAFPAKIEPDDGLFIDTWVRKPEEVPAALERLKQGVKAATQTYLEKIREANRVALQTPDTPEETGEQGRLNQILAQLDFEPSQSE